MGDLEMSTLSLGSQFMEIFLWYRSLEPNITYY